MGARRRRGGGVPEMGFRAGPFVLCKDGCCHQRRRNTNFGPENFFSLKKFPPHMCSQNDQRDVGIILSHVCWGRTPPLPGTAGRAAPAQTPPPGTATKEGEGEVGQMGFRAIPPPPPQSNFLPAELPRPLVRKHTLISEQSIAKPLIVACFSQELQRYPLLETAFVETGACVSTRWPMCRLWQRGTSTCNIFWIRVKVHIFCLPLTNVLSDQLWHA